MPYPIRSGRHAYTAGLSEALASAGVEVVALGIVDGDDEVPDGSSVEWRTVPTGQPAGTGTRLASRWPAMAVDRRTDAYRTVLAETLRAATFDVVVIDHLQMVWALEQLVPLGRRIVHVSHNHEATVRRRVASNAPWSNPRKAALHFDAERAARAELRLVRVAELTTAITEEDARLHRTSGADDVLVLPPGYAGARRPSRSFEEDLPRSVAIVTNLDWHVKRTNLERFLAEADPVFARAGIELRIIGPAPADFVAALRPSLRATRFVGEVPSVADALRDVRVGVISEPDGGGFKLKALDYVFGRVPVAVLAGSMEGLPLEPGRDHLELDSEGALADAVVALVDDPDRCRQLQERAFDRCADRFEWDERGRRLAERMTRCSRHG